jgi:hypothetical protein
MVILLKNTNDLIGTWLTEQNKWQLLPLVYLDF